MQFRNSRLGSLTNFLCMRAFSRELKLEILGEIGIAQSYEQVAAKLDQIPLNISRTTWHNWWIGRSFPEGDNLKTLYREFPELVAKWLVAPPNNRIQRYLIALDLTSTYKIKDFHLIAAGVGKNEPPHGHIAADKILRQIHAEWRPDYSGIISLRSIPEREGVDWSSERYKHFNFKYKVDTKQHLPVGVFLGPASELSSPASRRSCELYEPVNPFSIINFMLSYAVETNLPDPGLKQAFIFDFLAVICCALKIMKEQSPGKIIENSEMSKIFLLSTNYFWDEELEDDFSGDYWTLNHTFVGHFLSYLETFIDSGLLTDSWVLFAELKHIHYESLQITGLTLKEIVELFQSI